MIKMHGYETAPASSAGGAGGGGGGAIGRMFVYAGGNSIVSASCSPMSALGPASSCCTILTGRKLGGAGDLRKYVDVEADWDWSGVDERTDGAWSAVRAE